LPTRAREPRFLWATLLLLQDGKDESGESIVELMLSELSAQAAAMDEAGSPQGSALRRVQGVCVTEPIRIDS